VEVFAGRYVLVNQVEDGACGAVWRAWDIRRRSYCAAKLLAPAAAGSLLRFAREQSSRLEHPHVLAPTGWASDGDRVLLIMDLVHGGSVSDLLAAHRAFPLWFADALVEQLLCALALVHDRGIVHGNVKPSNLLLEPTGRGRPSLRLTDFAVAAAVGDSGSGVAPDPRQDLYAAGMVAFQLLTGRTPGTVGPPGSPPSSLPSDCPDGVPEAVWPLLRSLLEPSPSDRPRSAYAALQAWQEAVASVGATHAQADSDPVDVVDRVGPLPEGFEADGPVGYARADRADRADQPPTPGGNPGSLTPAPLTASGSRTGAVTSGPGTSGPGIGGPASAVSRGRKAKAATAVVAVVLVGLWLVATTQALGRSQASGNAAADPTSAAVEQGTVLASPSSLTSVTATATGTQAPSPTVRASSAPTNKPPPPRYVAASNFQPFGATYASFPLAASGTLLTIGSPTSYEHLWGAWLPGNWCTTSASFDIKLDASVVPSPGYGYAIAPQSTISNDQPVGWSLQHEWDAGLNGSFTRPVLLPDGAWAGGGSTPASDVTAPHHVTVSANGARYSVTIDGVSAGTFSGPATCGGLALRVWGGATARVDHIVTNH
jgi:serine/threonine-protein kinase